MDLVTNILEKARHLKNGQPAPSNQPQPNGYVKNEALRDDDIFAVPAFPVHVYPERIQEVIRDCERFMSFPTDITAASILAAVSIAIARTYVLRYQGEWVESPTVYMAIVAPPGSSKSHPLKFALHPVIEQNKRAIKEYAHAQRLLAEAGQATENLVDRQCIFSDFTIEALTRSIQKNKRGISVYIDELRAWFQNFNRYQSGSEQEFWLQNWSGTSMAVTRMTKKAWLERPAISVVGTIQPGLLDEIGKGGRAINGFSERILYVYPDHVPVLMLKKRMERSDTSVILQKNYAPVLQQILDRQLLIQGNEEEEDVPNELHMHISADDRITDYINDLKSRMDALDNEYIRNVYSKMQNYVLRFCILLNRLDYACAYHLNKDFPIQDDETITDEQAYRACQLAEYFLKHALKANNTINAQNPIAKLAKDERKFYKALPMGEPFTTSRAESIALECGISRAKMFRMLNEPDSHKKLFSKVRHGEYERIYV